MARMLSDAFMQNVEEDNMEHEVDDAEERRFQQLLEEAKKPLYGGCEKYSKLSVQLKCLNRWSNKPFSDVVSLLKDALPPNNLLPRSWYESKKMMADLGFSYKKIHAEQLKTCPIYGMSQEDWVLLVKYWDNVKKMCIDEQNNLNRQQLKTTHTLGSKSLPLFLEEQLTANPDGYTFLMAYLKAHQRKDETYLDEITVEHCEVVHQQALKNNVATSKDHRDMTPVLDTVFGGHKGGYERGVGTGAQLRRGASSSSPNYVALSKQLEKERRHNEVLSQMVDAMSQRMERLKC